MSKVFYRRKCCVNSCKNDSKVQVTLFKFPQDEDLRKKWIDFCGNDIKWMPNTCSRICIDHFDKSDLRHNKNGIKLNIKAIPKTRSVLQPTESAPGKFLGSKIF